MYFHKAANGEIIYVGKAAVLKNRVRQYFQDSRGKDAKTLALVAEIADTDWVETESEIDALFLESEMVKRYMPRYNVLLRDDKSQSFVRIDMKSEWPTVTLTRNPADDKANYYGPFYNGFALKKALRYLRRVYPFLTREPRSFDSKLETQIGLSPDRAEGSAAYKSDLKKLISYIKGNRKQLTRELERDMKTAAGLHDFEAAAELRNKLRHMQELQRRVMFGDREFLDISKDRALSELANTLKLPTTPTRIEGYDISHMGGKNVVASMVVFTNGVSDRAEYRKFKTNERNDDTANMYEVVWRRLSEKNLKSWGMPDLLLIDGGKGQLDAALRARDERRQRVPIVSIAKREELMVVHATRSGIDTGKLDELVRTSSPDIFVERSGEYFLVNFHPTQQNAGGHSRNLRGAPVSGTYSDIVKLFQRIRDESHRFAISYHTVLKRKAATASPLDDLPGFGPVTRKKLIQTFGSLRGVQAASEEEIAKVIGQKKAALLRQNLQ